MYEYIYSYITYCICSINSERAAIRYINCVSIFSVKAINELEFKSRLLLENYLKIINPCHQTWRVCNCGLLGGCRLQSCRARGRGLVGAAARGVLIERSHTTQRTPQIFG